MKKPTPALSILKPVSFCLAFTLLLVFLSRLKNFLPSQYERFTYGLLGIVAAVLVTIIYLRIDKKTFASIGLVWEKATVRRFVTGFGIGLLLSFLLTISLVMITKLELKAIEQIDLINFFTWTLALLPLAFLEELAFRAYPFVHLVRSSGVWVAQIVIALLFSLYHVAGGQSLISSLLGPGIWSFVFGLAAARSGGIAMATGLHYATNLVLAAFGQKSGLPALWIVEPGSSTANINLYANIIQLALLIVCILVMQQSFRYKKKDNPYFNEAIK